jgi:hypothetical protein
MVWLLWFLLFRVFLLDTCSIDTDATFIERFSSMIHVFFMYLWDAGLISLIFFRIFSHLHDFLCLTACLKRIFTLFIWRSLYTFCAMCWVQKWWTGSHANSYHSKSDLSKTALIPRCWSEKMIILSGPTTSLRHHYMNQPQFAALFSPVTIINISDSSYCFAS